MGVLCVHMRQPVRFRLREQIRIEYLRGAKVYEASMTLIVDEDVRGLDVAVDDAFAVHDHNSDQELRSVKSRSGGREAGRAHNIFQGAAGEVVLGASQNAE